MSCFSILRDLLFLCPGLELCGLLNGIAVLAVCASVLSGGTSQHL
jgi:hypothetical protein